MQHMQKIYKEYVLWVRVGLVPISCIRVMHNSICCTPCRHNWLQPLCCTEKRRHVQIYNYQRNGEVEYAPYLILISLWVASAKFPLKSLVSSLPIFTFYGFFDSFGSKSKPKLYFINCNCYIVLLDFCRIILSACILIPIVKREERYIAHNSSGQTRHDKCVGEMHENGCHVT